MSRFSVTPETWYHVSARIENRDVDHSSAVALRYYDASGKALKTETGVSCWRKDSQLTRYHRVVKTPPGAVRCDAIAANHSKRGESEIDEIRLDPSLADVRDDTAGTLVLNGSFEEADLAPDFVDVWTAPKGGVARSRDAMHGFHSLALSDGATLSYGASGICSLAVGGRGRLNGHLAVGSDDGEKTWLNGRLATAMDGRSRSCVPDSEMARVKLAKGENLLVVKITQGGGGNGHAIRFLSPADESPMTDLKVILR